MLPIRSIWGRPDLEIADVSADRVLEGFPELAHDDEVDACSGALEMLNPQMNSWGFYEATRQRFEQQQAARVPGNPEPTYARGSMEWAAEQKKLTGGGHGG